MRRFAIVGAGPSGLYVADQLLRAAPDAHIDVIEQLPTPLGLVRYGVAPDHPSTKGIGRILDRILSKERVSFWGNVHVGSDVSLASLTAHYDAVALATGAAVDKQLGLPGEDLQGVYGSSQFVRWYNSHPDSADVTLADVRNAVVIGAGNVALDVMRLLAKSASEFEGADLAPEIESELDLPSLQTVTLVARGGAAKAKFTQLELEELGSLERASVSVSDPDGLAGDTPILETLRAFQEPTQQKPVQLKLAFGVAPTRFVGAGKVTGVLVRNSDGVEQVIEADLVVKCIGYATEEIAGVQLNAGAFCNDEGKVRDGLYVVGWCKRGPSGTIPTNRAEAIAVADRIARDTNSAEPGDRGGLAVLLGEGPTNPVDYGGWRRIDTQEIARAREGRARHKFRRKQEMLDVLTGS